MDRFAALLPLKQQVCAANDCLALGRNNLKRRDPVNINIWHKNDVASRARADIIRVKRSGIVGNRLTNNDVGLGQLAAGFVFVKRSPIRRDRLKTGLHRRKHLAAKPAHRVHLTIAKKNTFITCTSLVFSKPTANPTQVKADQYHPAHGHYENQPPTQQTGPQQSPRACPP